MDNNNEYKRQMRLSLLNLAGELPNFCALLFSAISTKTVLIFVDLIDTSGNVLRNLFVVFISRILKKDLRFQYNYGIGKIEAISALLCDFVLSLSLIVMMVIAVRDIFYPRPVEGLMWFALLVKIAGIAGDTFICVKQRKICKTSDSLVCRSSLAVAIKNLIFDSTTFAALILITIFNDIRVFWYVSPVCSVLIGCYLMFITARRMRESLYVLSDRSADEKTQILILQTLSALYEKYDMVENIQSRVSGGMVIVDLSLGFSPDMTYSQLQDIADQFAAELAEKIPKSQLSLRINGKKPKDMELNDNE